MGADAAAPRVAVVILNWRRPDDTMACIRSVAMLRHAALDIIVCDNGSGDGSYQALCEALSAELGELNAARTGVGAPDLVFAEVPVDGPAPAAGTGARLWLAQTGRNGGYAFGNNVGIGLALRDPRVAYVWIINNDTMVDTDALTLLVDHAERHPDIGICGATAIYLEDRARVQTLGGGRFLPARARAMQIGEGAAVDAPIDQAAIEAELSYVNGAAALVRRSFIERVGLMDEGYFLYWEEMDWATRMRRTSEFRLGYCAVARVFHRVGAAAGSRDGGIPSIASTYWMTRSRVRYLRLHHPAILLIAFPLLVKAMAGEMRSGRSARARVMLRAALGLPLAT